MRKFDLNEPALFRPTDVPFPDMTGKMVLLVPLNHEAAGLAGLFGFQKKTHKKLFCAGVDMDAPAYPNLVLCANFMGAAAAVALLEVLVAKGARHFVFCGACGSLQANIGIGSVFVAEAAVSDEGTAPNYSHDSLLTPDRELTLKLTDILNSRGQAFTGGVMVSTDAVFRETKSKIDYFRSLGYQALDMETSALYAAAQFLNVRLSALYTVSDVFYDNQWVSGMGSREYKQGRREMAAVIKEMVVWMSENLKA